MAFSIKVPQVILRALDSPRVGRFFRPRYPPFAVEVTPQRLVAVALSVTGNRYYLERNRLVDLPVGLIQPSLLRPAVSDPAELKRYLEDALESLPGFERRLSLVLPDRVSKVSFLDLEKAGRTHDETVELIRWKLKRSTPFRVEDGRISYQAFADSNGNTRCVVSLVQGQVIEQFEEIIGSLGYDAGVIDLSSFNLWNLVQGQMAGGGDALLMNITEDCATAIIGRDGVPLFVRSKPPSGSEVLAWPEIRTELHPTLLYYQDRMRGPGIGSAIIRAPGTIASQLVELLASRYGIPATPVAMPGIGGIEAIEPERISLLAPAIGAALGR